VYGASAPGDRNRVALEAVIEQNLGPLLSRMQAANRPFAPRPPVSRVRENRTHGLKGGLDPRLAGLPAWLW
jgi:hypothetical protein